MSKVLGVLGGMGPAATLDFLAKLQAATPVKREQDHLRVLVDINPHVPDRNVSTSDPGPVLAAMATGRATAGRRSWPSPATPLTPTPMRSAPQACRWSTCWRRRAWPPRPRARRPSAC